MKWRRVTIAIILLAGACGGEGGVRTTTLAPAVTSLPITVGPTTPATSVPPEPTATSSTTTWAPPPHSLQEDARAVVMMGFIGTALDAATEAHLAQGGRAVILYERNIVSREQVALLTAALACAAAGPIIIATDQEPGRVNRLDAIGIPGPELAAPQHEFTAEVAAMAAAMLELGINLDLAPIVDVVQGPNPALEGRSFGSDTATVAERAVWFVEALQSQGVGSTAKHFPGHGLTRVDPHREVTEIGATLPTLAAEHFPPFTATIEAGVPAVMVGHPIYEAIDPEQPASLSPAVLSMLRDEFGFEGVALTDGLSMAGLRKIRTIDQIAVAALAAGQDLLLADRPRDVPQLVAAIEGAVQAGDLDRERVSEAANRVRRLAESLSPVGCPDG